MGEYEAEAEPGVMLRDYDPEAYAVGAVASTVGSVPPNVRDEEDIRAWEERLNRLEEELNGREAHGAGADDEPEKNWPSFYPLVHYSPELLSDDLRGISDMAMTAWNAMAIGLVLNFVTCLLFLTAGSALESPGSHVAMAAIFILIGVPVTLDFGPGRVFATLVQESVGSLACLKTLISLGVNIVAGALIGLGVGDSAGILVALDCLFDARWTLGLLSMGVTCALWVSVVLHVQCWRKVKGVWGGSRGREASGATLRTLRSLVTRVAVAVED